MVEGVIGKEPEYNDGGEGVKDTEQLWTYYENNPGAFAHMCIMCYYFST